MISDGPVYDDVSANGNTGHNVRIQILNETFRKFYNPNNRRGQSANAVGLKTVTEHMKMLYEQLSGTGGSDSETNLKPAVE